MVEFHFTADMIAATIAFAERTKSDGWADEYSRAVRNMTDDEARQYNKLWDLLSELAIGFTRMVPAKRLGPDHGND